MAIGEVGIHPSEFWKLTFAELQLLIAAHRRAREREWEQTRWLGAIMINLQVKPAKRVSPEKLVPLSFDTDRKQSAKLSKEDIAFMLENWK